jgi:hypothetical protein
MRLIAIVFAASCLLMAGCMKETDDTLWLPVPYGKIPYEVLSAAEQDSLRQHMPIYEGVTPPNIVGDYLASPMTLTFASDRYEGTFYDLHWRIENQNERNLASYKEWQRTAAGDGKEAHVIGSEDKFTAYTIEQTVDESRGWSCEQVTVISGTKTANGIEGYSYAIVMRNKQDSNGIIIDPDSYRVFTDGDGISSPVTNLKRL